jgi:PAS domain-containing protein
MITDAVKASKELKKDTAIFAGLVLLCALVSGGIILLAMAKKTLPQCIFPEALLKRPLDLIPTALLLMAGIYCLPMFYRWHRTSYSFALWVSLIPLLVAELHMVFGGDALYNLHVYAAHALKGFAYTLALIGLELDYRKTYLKAKTTSEELRGDLLLLDQEEESLSRLQHMLDAVLAHVCEGVYLKDVSGRLLRVNDVYADLYETEEVNHMVTQTEADFRPDEAAARNHEEDLKAMAEGVVVRDEKAEMHCADGRVIHVLRSRIPLWDKAGNVVGLLGLCRQTED